jgi:flagellar hook-basal body complex protein FliE
MAIQNLAAMRAYGKAITDQKELAESIQSTVKKSSEESKSFSATLTDSLKEVNDMQMNGASMLKSFASGDNQNIHELMITMQKASVAMNMTSAVRNKIMTAYQEMMRMQV